jgi:hypothetical protein
MLLNKGAGIHCENHVSHKRTLREGHRSFYMIYLTAIGLTPGGSSKVHIYTQTIHRTTTKKQKTIHRTTQKQYVEQHKNKLEQCGPCPVLVSYTLTFALQLRNKHGKPSVRVSEQFEWCMQASLLEEIKARDCVFE